MLQDHPEQENVIIEMNNDDNVAADEQQEDIDGEGNTGEQEQVELVMVKIVNLYWPAKIIKKIDGEITEIEVFGELKTRKTVEHIKLKAFEKLKKGGIWKGNHGVR